MGKNAVGVNIYKFILQPLKFPFDALEPYIDAVTMEIHHNRHLKTYVDNLNTALEGYREFQAWPLSKLLKNLGELPEGLRKSVARNGGGVFNHNFYFGELSPDSSQKPKGSLLEAIRTSFTSFEDFKNRIQASALDVFGSGYSWLVMDERQQLKIVQTRNQDTTLIFDQKPLLNIDVWEHAYYLKHYNKRADYLQDLFKVIDWDVIQKRFDDAIEAKNL